MDGETETLRRTPDLSDGFASEGQGAFPKCVNERDRTRDIWALLR